MVTIKNSKHAPTHQNRHRDLSIDIGVLVALAGTVALILAAPRQSSTETRIAWSSSLEEPYKSIRETLDALPASKGCDFCDNVRKLLDTSQASYHALFPAVQGG